MARFAENKNKVESAAVRAPTQSKSKAAATSSSSASPPSQNPPQSFGGGCCLSRLMLQNGRSFGKSGVPGRFMYFHSVADSSGDGEWVDFSNFMVDYVKLAFANRMPMVDIEFGGTGDAERKRYLFDFIRMLQIDFDSGSQRSIAWIDENGRCFFPRTFVDNFNKTNKDNNNSVSGENVCTENCGSISECPNPKIEIEVSVKRKSEGVCDESSLMKRQRFVLSCDDGVKNATSRWPDACLLQEGDSAYSLIKGRFLVEMKKVDPSVDITAIHQCLQSGSLAKARHDVFSKQIWIVNVVRGAANVQCAWYGGSAKAVESVLLHGFGGVPDKVRGAESYGIGVHLTPMKLPQLRARYVEADDNGEKHMIMCSVILGNVEKVEAGSQQHHPSTRDFDTGCDDPNNPRCYVVWPNIVNCNILPEAVVSFRSSNNGQGQVRALPTCKYTVARLLSKIRGLLPPDKFQEAVTLHDAFLAGRLAKNNFITQIREVIGDEILVSTIKEIRAQG